MKEKTCCFTGHREIPSGQRRRIFAKTEEAIEGLIKKGYLYFGAGGALGFDTIAAFAVLKLKERYPDIRLILVLPCFCEVPLENTKQYPHIRRYKGMLNGHAFRYFFISAFIFSLAAVTARPTDCWLQCSIFPISL